MPKLSQKGSPRCEAGSIPILLIFLLVTIATLAIHFKQKEININKDQSVAASDGYLVKPYLVYPSDKPMYPEYEQAVKAYVAELQAWYGKMVGKTFHMLPLQVIRSSENYVVMRCGGSPTNACLSDPAKLEGNLGQFINKAIHEGKEEWEPNTAALVFAAGAGGYAGGSKLSENSGWAIVGDWVLEPLSDKVNSWGIPCKYSDGWQCQGGVPKGTPAHELGHAFGLDHSPLGSQSIMIDHGLYPDKGFLQVEIDKLRSSAFFTNSNFDLKLLQEVSKQNSNSCPSNTVREECLGYTGNNINAYCWGQNNSYLGGICSSKCPQADKCGVKITPVFNSQDCNAGQKKECIGYSSNKINAYCWNPDGSYVGGICNKDCSNWEQCR